MYRRLFVTLSSRGLQRCFRQLHDMMPSCCHSFQLVSLLPSGRLWVSTPPRGSAKTPSRVHDTVRTMTSHPTDCCSSWWCKCPPVAAMCVSMMTIQVFFTDKITAVNILQKSGNNARDDQGWLFYKLKINLPHCPKNIKNDQNLMNF